MVDKTASNSLVGAAGLSVSGISKSFGATKALNQVSASFPANSITALLGQNGSGKSTLIKILAGFYSPDGDVEIKINGDSLSAPVEATLAHAAGLRFLHQDLGLLEELTVADNFAFAQGFGTPQFAPIRRRQTRAAVRRSLDLFEIDVSPEALIKNLTPTERTMVGIARALSDDSGGPAGKPKIMVLDEPTATLPASEVGRVFAALEKARDAGNAIIFVSHRIDEVLRLADRLVVLRDGKLVADREMAGLGAEDLVKLIVGSSVPPLHISKRTRPSSDKPVLRTRGLSGWRLWELDFELFPGEILGVTGLLGCGRSELARLVSGSQTPRRGEIQLDGAILDCSHPADAISKGIVYVPQDRLLEGCFPELTVRENVMLPDLGSLFRRGRIHRETERNEVERVIRLFNVRPPLPERPLGALSGGNQQKVVIAKWLRLQPPPRVLVLDEPTQGVDIGAKREIRELIASLAAKGTAVIVASSDYDEVVEICDRVLLLQQGKLTSQLAGEQITEQNLTLMAGGAT